MRIDEGHPMIGWILLSFLLVLIFASFSHLEKKEKEKAKIREEAMKKAEQLENTNGDGI